MRVILLLLALAASCTPAYADLLYRQGLPPVPLPKELCAVTAQALESKGEAGVVCEASPDHYDNLNRMADLQGLKELAEQTAKQWQGTDQVWCGMRKEMGVKENDERYWPYGRKPGPCPWER